MWMCWDMRWDLFWDWALAGFTSEPAFPTIAMHARRSWRALARSSSSAQRGSWRFDNDNFRAAAKIVWMMVEIPPAGSSSGNRADRGARNESHGVSQGDQGQRIGSHADPGPAGRDGQVQRRTREGGRDACRRGAAPQFSRKARAVLGAQPNRDRRDVWRD